jgi:hypothetical protein
MMQNLAQRYVATVVYYPLRISIIAFATLLLSGAAISHRSGEGMASPLIHNVGDVPMYEDGGTADYASQCTEYPPRCADCDWSPVCYGLVVIIIILVLALLTVRPKPVPAITPVARKELIAAIEKRFEALCIYARSCSLAPSIPLLDQAKITVLEEINKLK